MIRRNAFWGGLFALCATLALITGIIRGMACSAALMESEMTRFAPAEKTGLPETEYPGMAAHIADYLAGRKDSFQYILPGADGESLICFHPYELTHMEDCRGLIRLDGWVCLGAVITAGLALAGMIRGGKRNRADAFRGIRNMMWVLSMLAPDGSADPADARKHVHRHGNQGTEDLRGGNGPFPGRGANCKTSPDGEIGRPKLTGPGSPHGMAHAGGRDHQPGGDHYGTNEITTNGGRLSEIKPTARRTK